MEGASSGLPPGPPAASAPFADRYARQVQLPQIGVEGQARLGLARVTLIGCGALGTTLAQVLVRAGVGHLRIVDRDFVEAHNLQRQTLFGEADVSDALPKVHAAARRLRAINSSVVVDPVAADAHAGNIERLCAGADLLLDGTDNFQVRYLINDLAVKTGRPWVYGACIGWEGRVMVIRPSRGACLRCLFDQPPPPGTTPTCDVAGVIGSAAVMVAAWQAAEALKLLVGADDAALDGLAVLDLWASRVRVVGAPRRADCPCCGQRRFEFLDAPADHEPVSLCGRDAVQIAAPAADGVGSPAPLDLAAFADRLAAGGAARVLKRNPYLLRFAIPRRGRELVVSLFPDGRAILQGTTDFAEARSVYAQFVGQ